MMLSRKIRTQFGKYCFLKELKKFSREPEIVNFDQATSIGFLYDATLESDTEVIKNYTRNLRSNSKKDVLAMGYVDKKKPHKSQYAQFGLDFFTRKDLNFIMIPVDPSVQNFIEKKFDILVNVNSSNSFPLQYISALSNAKFKVARFQNKKEDAFDMMIKIDNEAPLKTVLEEIEKYLRLIHSS